jgi:hypothetical protein
MERTQIFDLMGELKLYGMKAAFDEITATAVKRQHEPQRIVGDLLNAEINEKQARYWSTQLERAVPHAFSLIDLAPDDDGVKPGIALDYVAYDGKPVYIRFQFTKTGKIAASACRRGRKVA